MQVTFTVNGVSTDVALKEPQEKTNEKGNPYVVYPISYGAVEVNGVILRLSGCIIGRRVAQAKGPANAPQVEAPAPKPTVAKVSPAAKPTAPAAAIASLL